MIIPQHWKCKKTGHEWCKVAGQQKRCINCFTTIADGATNRGAYSVRRINVSKAVDASRHLKNLQAKGRTPRRIFEEKDDTACVANLIYHLRYVLKWEAFAIERQANMAPQSLNWYLINYPWYPGIVHNS